MKALRFIPSILVALVFLAGCSASEEGAATDSKPAGEFTRTDTLRVVPDTDQPAAGEADMPSSDRNLPQEKPAEEGTPPAETGTGQAVETPPASRTGLVMWSVQIGAFKNEPGANQLVAEAKAKLNTPLYKDYEPSSGFWKVTVGSFQTREQASQYKAEVQAKGYTDSFVVEVRR